MLERYTSSKPSLAREVTLTARLAGKWQMLMAGRWEVGGGRVDLRFAHTGAVVGVRLPFVEE